MVQECRQPRATHALQPSQVGALGTWRAQLCMPRNSQAGLGSSNSESACRAFLTYQDVPPGSPERISVSVESQAGLEGPNSAYEFQGFTALGPQALKHITHCLTGSMGETTGDVYFTPWSRSARLGDILIPLICLIWRHVFLPWEQCVCIAERKWL